MHLARPSMALAVAAVLALTGPARAQLAYGLSGAGDLFSFDLGSPGTRTTIGNVGFNVAAMAGRPGGGELYALSFSSTLGSLYWIDMATASPTLLGSFAISGSAGGNGFDLTSATAFGLAADPRSLQGDGSFHFVLVADNGDALTISSNDGMIIAELPDVTGVGTVQLAALGFAQAGTLTAFAGTPAPLYGIDYLNDRLVSFDAGTGATTDIGAGLGHDVGNALTGDVFTNGSTATFYIFDTTGGAADFYSVDAGTGAATLISTLAGGDFAGGFAIMAIPEPSTMALGAGLIGFGLALGRKGALRFRTER